MKIRLQSDLHLERGPFTYEDLGEDVVVLAGDIHVGTQGIEWAKSIPKPVIYVAGNHEHWGQDIFENIESLRAAAAGSNVHFLENDRVVIDGVQFLGCTLWTDYGESYLSRAQSRQGQKFAEILHREMMRVGLNIMNDTVSIKAQSWWTEENKARFAELGEYSTDHFANNFRFVPHVAYDMHKQSAKWLGDALYEAFDGPTVVVTHHAPSYKSLLRSKAIKPEALDTKNWDSSEAVRGRDHLDLYRVAAYASAEDGLVSEVQLGLWLHGHIHTAVRYPLGSSLVVSNPRGYVFSRTSGEENGDGWGFERDMLIDTDTRDEVVEIALREFDADIQDARDFMKKAQMYMPYLKNKDDMIVDMTKREIDKLADLFNVALAKAVQGIFDALIAEARLGINEQARRILVGYPNSPHYDESKFDLGVRLHVSANFVFDTALEEGKEILKQMEAAVDFVETHIPARVRLVMGIEAIS